MIKIALRGLQFHTRSKYVILFLKCLIHLSRKKENYLYSRSWRHENLLLYLPYYALQWTDRSLIMFSVPRRLSVSTQSGVGFGVWDMVERDSVMVSGWGVGHYTWLFHYSGHNAAFWSPHHCPLLIGNPANATPPTRPSITYRGRSTKEPKGLLVLCERVVSTTPHSPAKNWLRK